MILNAFEFPKKVTLLITGSYGKAESTVRLATLRYFPTQFVIHFVALDYGMTT